MRWILATLAFLNAGTALAADASFCNRYAGDAVQSAMSVQGELGAIVLGSMFGVQPAFGDLDTSYPLPENCGYSGPRWSTNYDEHYNWCLGADEATANAETAARALEAQYCSVCIEYVNVASKFEDEARKLNCPLRGARWPSDANGSGLMQFCLAQGHSDIAATARWLQGVLNSGLKRVNACAAAKRSNPLSHPMPKFATPAGVGRINRGP